MQTMMEVIQLSGTLDSSQAGEMRHNVMEQIQSGAQRVVLDLQNVTFIDSSGLGALVMALKAVHASGGEMFLCALGEQPRMLFELTGVDSVFRVFADQAALNAALAALPES
jgi:anti-sigma B factor antagonist